MAKGHVSFDKENKKNDHFDRFLKINNSVLLQENLLINK